jgi:hypothetical protein
MTALTDLAVWPGVAATFFWIAPVVKKNGLRYEAGNQPTGVP